MNKYIIINNSNSNKVVGEESLQFLYYSKWTHKNIKLWFIMGSCVWSFKSAKNIITYYLVHAQYWLCLLVVIAYYFYIQLGKFICWYSSLFFMMHIHWKISHLRFLTWSLEWSIMLIWFATLICHVQSNNQFCAQYNFGWMWICKYFTLKYMVCCHPK